MIKPLVVVQDIKTGLENPLDIRTYLVDTETGEKRLLQGFDMTSLDYTKHQKVDWNDKYIAKQFNDSMAELFGVDPNPPKPSLLTRIKRIGRKK